MNTRRSFFNCTRSTRKPKGRPTISNRKTSAIRTCFSTTSETRTRNLSFIKVWSVWCSNPSRWMHWKASRSGVRIVMTTRFQFSISKTRSWCYPSCANMKHLTWLTLRKAGKNYGSVTKNLSQRIRRRWGVLAHLIPLMSCFLGNNNKSDNLSDRGSILITAIKTSTVTRRPTALTVLG